MKKIVLTLIFIFQINILSQNQPISGVAVLFDNSGSMKQNFTPAELNDAKELVKNLLVNGNYDQTKWNKTGTIPLAKLFNAGNLLYLHAFGNFNNNIPVIKPEINYPGGEQDVSNILDKFFGTLNFSEQWTLLECAKLYSWSFITEELKGKNASGKNFFTKIIQITDEVGEGTSQCSDLMKSWVASSGSIYSENIYELKSTLTKNNTLYCYVYTIGPHTFEKVQSSDCVPQITLSVPINNQKFKEGVLSIPLRWDVTCDVSDIKLVIRSVAPSVQIANINTGNSRIYNLDLNKVKTLLDDKKITNPVKLRAIITGKIKDQYGKDSTISTSVNFSAYVPSDPIPIGKIAIIIGIIIALIAGFIFLPKLIKGRPGDENQDSFFDKIKKLFS